MKLPPSRSGSIARNSLLNLAGQGIPLVVGIACIPFVIQGLGVERFGILSLAWMLLGYFVMFDFGLGRATTKFFAEKLHDGRAEELRSLFWTSCAINILLGSIGGILVVALAPVLANSVFEISPGLEIIAERTFTLLGLSLPLVLVSTVFRGTLEAARRFDYVNVVVVAANSLNYILPAAGILFGLDVSQIVLLLMVSRLMASSTYFLLCLRLFPVLLGKVSFSLNQTKLLMGFGGWLSISNAVQPMLMYLDRFVIGSILSLSAVTYYTAPYEIAVRLLVIPVSLAVTLFPSFSLLGYGNLEESATLFLRSAKFLMLIMGPLVMLVVFFAPDILHVWLGGEFAEKSTVVFQILAIGVLFNSPANVPYSLIQGLGRPDITAKFHLLELVLYVPLVWLLVKALGIVGGALAWSIRITLDAVLLFSASSKLMGEHLQLEYSLGRSVILVATLMCVMAVGILLQTTLPIRVAVAMVALILFTISCWRFVLDDAERGFVVFTARRVVQTASGGSHDVR